MWNTGAPEDVKAQRETGYQAGDIDGVRGNTTADMDTQIKDETGTGCACVRAPDEATKWRLRQSSVMYEGG